MEADDQDSASSDGFGPVPESLKRRWQAEAFDQEHEQQVAKRIVTDSVPSQAGSLWQELVVASARTLIGSSMTLPWERGVAGLALSVGKVFQLPHERWTMLPTTPIAFLQGPDPQDRNRADRAAIITRLEAIPGAWKFAAQRLKSVQVRSETKANARDLALAKWKEVLTAKPEASVLGRTLLADLMAFKTDLHLAAVIQDVFAMKATSTIDKRGNHLLLYMAFCKREGFEPFPVQERFFYNFVKNEQSRKSASAATSCRESMHLAHTVIGLDGSKESADSPRVVGLCHRLLLGKKPRKQAKVLTCDQVCILEQILEDEAADLIDRVAAGHFLFLLNGRIRWSDAECVENLEEDLDDLGNGYLQADALGSKTSISASQKTSFFPFVMTVNGLVCKHWHRTWLEVRSRAGLVKLPRNEEEQYRLPLMPSVLVGGKFSWVAMTSDEGSKFLRALLRMAGQTQDQISGISTHSLKATVLSWLRKYGVDPFHSKVAGYHSIAGEGSMFSYARDNVAATLRVIDEVLDAIRKGEFKPDTTRSGYFDLSKKAQKPVVSKSGREDEVQPKHVGREVVRDEDWEEIFQESMERDDKVLEVRFPEGFEGDIPVGVEPNLHDPTPSSSSDDSSSSDSDVEAMQALSYIRAPASAKCESLVVHNFNKTLHRVKDSTFSRTACGKIIHDGYNRFDEDPDFPFHRCTICFGSVASSSKDFN